MRWANSTISLPNWLKMWTKSWKVLTLSRWSRVTRTWGETERTWMGEGRNNTGILGGSVSVDNLGWLVRASGRAQL